MIKKLMYEIVSMIFFVAVVLMGMSLINKINLSRKSQPVFEAFRREFQDGFAKLEDIFPDKNWDEVCLVRAYTSFRDPEDLKKYFGIDESNYPLSMPHTSDKNYGVGFSFLENKKFVKFIEIPIAFLDPITAYRQDERVGLFVVPIVQIIHSGQTIKLGFPGDFNFVPEEGENMCFSRSSGFMQIIDHRQILIGE